MSFGNPYMMRPRFFGPPFNNRGGRPHGHGPRPRGGFHNRFINPFVPPGPMINPFLPEEEINPMLPPQPGEDFQEQYEDGNEEETFNEELYNMGEGGGGGWMHQQPPLHPNQVLAWLDQQPPFIIRQIHFHSGWLLEQAGEATEEMGMEEEEEQHQQISQDQHQEQPSPALKKNKKAKKTAHFSAPTTGWYDEKAINAPKQSNTSEMKPQPLMKSTKPHFGLGYKKTKASPSNNQPLQWTPAGWTVKDNTHKITTTMKPIPKPDIIPQQCVTYPEANADRNKVKMLENNKNMMQFELNKICRKFRISTLNKDDLTVYPEDQQDRLKVAIDCVANAEKTFLDFKDFLTEEKYKEWNDEQTKKYEEQMKLMIGETPTGIPHKRKNEDEGDKSNTASQSINLPSSL